MKPILEGPPSILNRPDGSVLFECMCSANPPPEIKWFFKEQELSAGDRHAMKMKKMVGKFACTLQIKSPNQQDQGIYKIVASNSDGSAQQEQTYVAQCVGDSFYKD